MKKNPGLWGPLQRSWGSPELPAHTLRTTDVDKSGLVPSLDTVSPGNLPTLNPQEEGSDHPGSSPHLPGPSELLASAEPQVFPRAL